MQPAFALPAGQPGREVQQPEPQRLGFGAAQFPVGQHQVAEAGEQGGGQRHHLGPGNIDLPLVGGSPAQPEGLGLLDLVLDVGVDVGAVVGAHS